MNKRNSNHWTQRRHRGGCISKVIIAAAIPIIILATIMILAISGNIGTLQNEMHGYRAFDPTNKIARVCGLHPNVTNKLWVNFTSYSSNNQVSSKLTKLLNGNQARLEAATISYLPLMHLAGLQSGIKLTHLQAYYQQTPNTALPAPTSVILNGGEDAEFAQLQNNPSPVVTATLNNSFTIPSDGKTYDLFATESGLMKKLAPPQEQIKACGIN